jgi:ParB/RepB/Spo0J family partition protein
MGKKNKKKEMKAMNKNNVLVSIDVLYGNPFQPRKEEDPAMVIELAQNILHNATEEFDGLLQVPTVRWIDDGYQLAFGHTRLEAFRYLVDQGHERYAQMRVNVRDLSDLQMFELAVTENIKRRDLNPIEQAEAIRTYQEEFGKTSAEAAEFFGVAASTVRGLVRLLNLPEAAQEKVRSGEINTGAARALLVVEKLMGEEGVAEVMERMADDGDGPMEAIEGALRFSSKTERLDRDDEWVKVDPFPRKHWKPVTKKEIEKLVLGEERLESITSEDLDRLYTFAVGGMDVTDEAFPMFSPDGLEQVRVLVNPPGCMACPLHAQLDGDHYCALKACAERKQEAWFSETAESVSAETGIPMYDKARDGAFEKLNMYNDAAAKMWKKGHEDLRVMPAKDEVYANRQVDLDVHVQVVVVGKTLEKMRKKDEQQKVNETKKQEKEMPWEVRRKVSDVCSEFKKRFIWDAFTPIFESSLNGITNIQVLASLAGVSRFSDLPQDMDDPEDLIQKAIKSKKDGARQLRRLIVVGVFEDDIHINSYNKNPFASMIKDAKIPELAKTWGVKLPKDWDVQVKKYEDECTAAVAEIVKAWKEKGK